MPDKDNFGAKLQSCPYQKNVTMAALNFDMYSGECKEVSPCLQKDRAEDTLVYPLHDVKAYGLDEDRNGQEENSGTLRAHKSGGSEHIVAYDAFTLTIGANQTTGRPGDIAAINAIARRLTPLECERLQGFPDNHTAIPGAKDGPRYAAIGNSMAVPVMKWIGERIAMMDKIMRELKAPTP
jgi:site-specific DNA-cytosine methylase